MQIINRLKKYFSDVDKDTKHFALIMISVIIICLIINTFMFQIAYVKGSSMLPTLKNGQLLIINKMEDHYERYSIIVFKNKNENLIKRVIGLPGETIQIQDNIIYINDIAVNDITDIQMNNYGIAEEKIHLDDDEYFVMGDNRNNSLDSRYEMIGPIKLKKIKGRVVFRFIPFKTYNKNPAAN